MSNLKNRYDKKSAGRPGGKTLFKELEGGEDAPYSLREFHECFMKHLDPTCYTPAIELIGDWEEWQRLLSATTPLQEEVRKWIEEIEIILSRNAFNKVIDISKTNSNASFAANKFVLDTFKIIEKSTNKKGRPSNKKQTNVSNSDYQEDFNRLMQVVDLESYQTN